MTSPRNRRSVTVAAWIAVALSLLVTTAFILGVVRERTQIQRSRAIRLGMTTAEVDKILGRGATRYTTRSHTGLLYGASGDAKLSFVVTCQSWLGRQFISLPHTPWSVRMDKDGRIDRIERGNEVEEAPIGTVLPVAP